MWLDRKIDRSHTHTPTATHTHKHKQSERKGKKKNTSIQEKLQHTAIQKHTSKMRTQLIKYLLLKVV